MTQTTLKKLPARRSPLGRALFIGFLTLLGSLLLFVIVWKWDTLGFIFHAESISVKPRSEILSALNREGYSIYENKPDGVSYLVLDDQIDVRAQFRGEELSALHISFNYNHISIQTVQQAVASADLLLGPFFTMPEIEALVVLLSSDLSIHASDNAIHCTIPLAGYSLRVDGNQKYGDVEISMTK